MRNLGRGLIFPDSRYGIQHRDPAEDEPWPARCWDCGRPEEDCMCPDTGAVQPHVEAA